MLRTIGGHYCTNNYLCFYNTHLSCNCFNPSQSLELIILVYFSRYSEVEVTEDYLMNIIAFQSHERKEALKLYVR